MLNNKVDSDQAKLEVFIEEHYGNLRTEFDEIIAAQKNNHLHYLALIKKLTPYEQTRLIGYQACLGQLKRYKAPKRPPILTQFENASAAANQKTDESLPTVIHSRKKNRCICS
ncbi:MAG: hypothetical protein BGO43_03930 [Gammaproteobacteria bacterium 39-13]|nr:hypothetical protein [Gammaproteobacteria bacterium]OJV96022.1 MAG: hypothetical protein BGO43_03930 [Gammaproteobacteria bacterium 39-13]